MKYISEKAGKNKLKLIYITLIFILAQSLLLLYVNFHRVVPDQTYKNLNYVSDTPKIRDSNPKISIIIDDFGQNQNGVKEIMSIRKPMTFAIMPFLDFSIQNATKAHDRGFEVIVHLPMQSTNKDIAAWLGPRPIKLSLKDDEIKKTVYESIDAIPFSAGVNIHMGSMSSEDGRVMSSVMEVIKEKKFYFIDSKTSKYSICKSVAKRLNISFSERDIFLENPEKDKQYIRNQLKSAVRIALKKGKAIVIGHVGSAGGKITAQTIIEMIPYIESKGVSLVFASEII